MELRLSHFKARMVILSSLRLSRLAKCTSQSRIVRHMTHKTKPATSDYLLRGTVFALEQCGLLLRDARILCEAGSYASAVVLTALAARKLKAPSSMAKRCGST